MSQLMTLLNIACGAPLSEEDAGKARRLQLAIAGLLLSLVLAAIWGVAVGSRDPTLMIANAYKLPMIILLSAVFAIPAGMLTWKLSGAECRGTDLLLGFTSGVMSGTLVMAVLSPVVALYYHSSAWWGPVLAQGVISLAMLVGGVVFSRAVMTRVEGRRRTVVLALVVFKAIHVATLLQLIALASPILPERTRFDRGIDEITAPAGKR
jgi:hypothetical protein